MMIRAVALGISASLAMASADQAQAQAGRSSSSEGLGDRPYKRACFIPRPPDSCQSFWITESGTYNYLTSPPSHGAEPREAETGTLVMWELGRMFNRGERNALGASVLLATNDDTFRFGLKGRYRRWLTPEHMSLAFAYEFAYQNAVDAGRARVLHGAASVDYGRSAIAVYRLHPILIAEDASSPHFANCIAAIRRVTFTSADPARRGSAQLPPGVRRLVRTTFPLKN